MTAIRTGSRLMWWKEWDRVLAVERADGSVRNASISRFAAVDDHLELASYNSVDHLPVA